MLPTRLSPLVIPLCLLAGCGSAPSELGGTTTTSKPKVAPAPATTSTPALTAVPPTADVPVVTPSARGRFWRTPLAPDAPVDSRSPQLVSALAGTVARTRAENRPPWISISSCSTRVYQVGAGQPTVRVALDQPVASWNVTLRRALAKVPLPSAAEASNCHDRVIVITQPSRDRMWELWHARRENGTWHADWGGATRHAAENDGSYGPSDWPGADTHWGASASSITLLGGAMRLDEFARGRIDHALSLALPDVAAGRWAAPAERTDGRLTGPDAIPYGARFRLDPKLDLDALHLPRATRVIAEAAQRYGLVVQDKTYSIVSLAAEAPPSGPGPNPWNELIGGPAGSALTRFPWDRLELMKMDLRRG